MARFFFLSLLISSFLLLLLLQLIFFFLPLLLSSPSFFLSFFLSLFVSFVLSFFLYYYSSSSSSSLIFFIILLRLLHYYFSFFLSFFLSFCLSFFFSSSSSSSSHVILLIGSERKAKVLLSAAMLGTAAWSCFVDHFKSMEREPNKPAHLLDLCWQSGLPLVGPRAWRTGGGNALPHLHTQRKAVSLQAGRICVPFESKLLPAVLLLLRIYFPQITVTVTVLKFG